jgi:hypothetical protein
MINGLTQLTVIPCGLGAPDDLELKRLPITRGMVDRTLGNSGHETEGFLVARFDRLWSTIAGGNLRVDGVKVDVQGMEVEAIIGMGGVLRTFHPKLALEVHQGVNRSQLLDALESCGYAHPGLPIDHDIHAADGEYLDDRSYQFTASAVAASPARE